MGSIPVGDSAKLFLRVSFPRLRLNLILRIFRYMYVPDWLTPNFMPKIQKFQKKSVVRLTKNASIVN